MLQAKFMFSVHGFSSLKISVKVCLYKYVSKWWKKSVQTLASAGLEHPTVPVFNDLTGQCGETGN